MTTPPQRRAIRLVVILLVASLTASVTFALLTWLFRHDVLAYQQARDPAADPDALAATLWTRPIPILAVAVLYFWVARRLLAGAASAYRRVRIVSVLGLIAVAWLLFSAAYPPWLRGVQAVQLVLLAALVAAVNRPLVRSAFPAVPDLRPRNRRAALLLAVLAPFVAEVSLGTVPLRMAWVMPIYIPIYGAGALFIREIVRRTGGGVANLLLLGVAYGLVEEGLALQSLTSPHLYGAAEWAPRLFGFNTAYTELNLAYHAVFSVTIPILLVELLFPRHGTTPYLRRGGLIATGVLALLGAALLRVTVPPAEDPGYTMPTTAILLVAAAAAAVTVIGLRIRVRRESRPVAPPHAPLLAVTTGVAVFGFLAFVYPLGDARQPLWTHGAWVFLPMSGAAAIAVAAWWALRHWSASPAWTPRHVLAACAGALTAHTLFGLTANADSTPDRLFLLAIALLTAAGATLLIRRQDPIPPPPIEADRPPLPSASPR
ncbi:hypothetical protein [Paractinoplanes toevensis]|uniref:Uncharacterized protein n=1 Tax=Paractinoplanes toevensis TaxID=571911 RepID=A0A919W4P7_9ACTN|nr:hypothetical protein [Actinoplanes toevensis]GIM94354.1 hypothetical protein Ato02nite_061470 [Actinoplanes toevensis]